MVHTDSKAMPSRYTRPIPKRAKIRGITGMSKAIQANGIIANAPTAAKLIPRCCKSTASTGPNMENEVTTSVVAAASHQNFFMPCLAARKFTDSGGIQNAFSLLVGMVRAAHHGAHGGVGEAHFVGFFFKHFEGVGVHVALDWQMRI
jgi:hypothetical protein